MSLAKIKDSYMEAAVLALPDNPSTPELPSLRQEEESHITEERSRLQSPDASRVSLRHHVRHPKPLEESSSQATVAASFQTPRPDEKAAQTKAQALIISEQVDSRKSKIDQLIKVRRERTATLMNRDGDPNFLLKRKSTLARHMSSVTGPAPAAPRRNQS